MGAALLAYALLSSCTLGELGPALQPAALTAQAVLDCVEACAEAPDLAAALRSKLECTPQVIGAAKAWCGTAVLDGPFCAALGVDTP